ncbi:MAG: radical SAM protein, partial [Acidobacteria bacterium]|nr:radical SAM protein [Acidobacteriota bacterium]
MDKKIVKCKLYSDYNGKIINDTLLYQANGIHITLRLTNNCNYKCTYCDLHRENEKLEPLENFKSICDTLLRADREYYEFYIHGGEPSLHPMFHEIMHYIQQTFAWRKLFILVQTNLYKPFSFYLEVPFSVKYMVSYHPMKTKFKVFKKALENLYLNQRLIGVDFMLEDTNRRKNKGDFLSLKKTKFGHIIHPRKIRSGEFSIFNHPELFPEYAKILEKYKAIDRQYLIT